MTIDEIIARTRKQLEYANRVIYQLTDNEWQEVSACVFRKDGWMIERFISLQEKPLYRVFTLAGDLTQNLDLPPEECLATVRQFMLDYTG